MNDRTSNARALNQARALAAFKAEAETITALCAEITETVNGIGDGAKITWGDHGSVQHARARLTEIRNFLTGQED